MSQKPWVKLSNAKEMENETKENTDESMQCRSYYILQKACTILEMVKELNTL